MLGKGFLDQTFVGKKTTTTPSLASCHTEHDTLTSQSLTVLLLCITRQQVAGCDETGSKNKCLPRTHGPPQSLGQPSHISTFQQALICGISFFQLTPPTVEQLLHLPYNSSHANGGNLPQILLQGAWKTHTEDSEKDPTEFKKGEKSPSNFVAYRI